MRSILTLTLLVTLSATGFGQKLKSGGYEVSIKSFEKKEIELFGKKQEIYLGIIKVKSKDAQKGEYRFYLPKSDEKFSHLTIRNYEDEILEPRLYYDDQTESFSYFRGTDKEGSKKLLANKSVEEMVLSGAIIWLKLEK